MKDNSFPQGDPMIGIYKRLSDLEAKCARLEANQYGTDEYWKKLKAVMNDESPEKKETPKASKECERVFAMAVGGVQYCEKCKVPSMFLTPSPAPEKTLEGQLQEYVDLNGYGPSCELTKDMAKIARDYYRGRFENMVDLLEDVPESELTHTKMIKYLRRELFGEK